MENPLAERAPRWTLTVLVAAAAAGSVAYHFVHAARLGRSGALFIGMPAVMAIVCAALSPKSVTGLVLKAITIVLCLSMPLFGEGLICVIMAAPIFYGVGLAFGLACDFLIRRGERRAIYLLVPPFALLSLEGTSDRLSVPRRETVVVRASVYAHAEDVERALAGALPVQRRDPPAFLGMGFPRPAAMRADGNRRRLHWEMGGEPAGIVEWEATRREAGRWRFDAVSDTTPIADWIEWERTIVEWEEVEPGRVEVVNTVIWKRRLDPAWYFGPWERFAVRKAARHMIASLDEAANSLPDVREEGGGAVFSAR